MVAEPDFRRAYRDLESRMKALAAADGDVFVPNPEPEGVVQYVLICMEPSLGRWASSKEEAEEKVQAGFRNFLYSMEDFILHFCARTYLCGPGERYHITDFSKGAMPVRRAAKARRERYDRWYGLLLEEIDLVAGPEAKIVTVGGKVARYLKQRGFDRRFTPIMHYSGRAARARNTAIEGREERFEEFRDGITKGDLITTAERAFDSAGVPARFRDATLTRLANGRLTTSRRKLLFIYKEAFEGMKR